MLGGFAPEPPLPPSATPADRHRSGWACFFPRCRGARPERPLLRNRCSGALPPNPHSRPPRRRRTGIAPVGLASSRGVGRTPVGLLLTDSAFNLRFLLHVRVGAIRQPHPASPTPQTAPAYPRNRPPGTRIPQRPLARTSTRRGRGTLGRFEEGIDVVRLGFRFRRSDRWSARWKAEAFEDRLDRLARVDRGENPHAAVACVALQSVNRPHPAHEFRPGVVPRPRALPLGRRTIRAGVGWRIARLPSGTAGMGARRGIAVGPFGNHLRAGDRTITRSA